MLRNIVTVALTINMFLLGCEVFTEFYSDSAHITSIGGVSVLRSARPQSPGAVDLDADHAQHRGADLVLYTPLADSVLMLNVACVF